MRRVSIAAIALTLMGHAAYSTEAPTVGPELEEAEAVSRSEAKVAADLQAKFEADAVADVVAKQNKD